MSSQAIGTKAGYKERFESLSFGEPYVSPYSRLWDSKPGTFDEELKGTFIRPLGELQEPDLRL